MSRGTLFFFSLFFLHHTPYNFRPNTEFWMPAGYSFLSFAFLVFCLHFHSSSFLFFLSTFLAAAILLLQFFIYVCFFKLFLSYTRRTRLIGYSCTIGLFFSSHSWSSFFLFTDGITYACILFIIIFLLLCSSLSR